MSRESRQAADPELARHVQSMLADGPLGVEVSMLCLTAASVVKAGGSIDSVRWMPDDSEGPLPPELEAAYKDTMRRVHALYLTLSLEDLDLAIELHTAHLRAAGYNVEAGLIQ